MMNWDDSALLASLNSGNQVALTALYERHRRPVFARSFIETGSRADAEEVLQDAFLLLWQKRRRIRLVGESALPWLLVTARNLARNQRRYQAHRAAVDLPVVLVDATTDPEYLAARNELAAVIDAALEALDPLDRQILHLCLVDGMSYLEAAERLQSTHATVRNRLSRARKSLRSSFSGDPRTDLDAGRRAT